MGRHGHLNGAQLPTREFPVAVTGEAFERLLADADPVHVHYARLRTVHVGDVVWVTNAHDATGSRRTLAVKVVCVGPDRKRGGNLYVGLKRTSVKKSATP